MELLHLKYFQTIARLESVTQAAEELHARKGGNGSAENRTYDTAYLLGGKEQAEDAALDFRACILS